MNRYESSQNRVSINSVFLFILIFVLFLHSSSTPFILFSDLYYTTIGLSSVEKKENTKEYITEIITTYINNSPDAITSLYNERAIRKAVKDFFISEIGSEKIVNTVLLYAEKEDLPIGLVFSLISVESRFDPYVVNINKNNTRDRGLFQLNSNTFRRFTNKDFFDIETNVNAGVKYLRYAFDLDPDPRIALAIYNAGPSRPLRGIIPDSTRIYISRILARHRALNKRFVKYIYQYFLISDKSIVLRT